MSKTKVLITGSCSFMASNFIRQAIYEKQPYYIVSLDRPDAADLNSMYWNKNHNSQIIDIRDQHILDVVFKSEAPEIVIHGSAENDKKDSSYLLSMNVLGTQNIINSCINHKVKKLIFISSDEVYGSLNTPNDMPFIEDSALNPTSIYATSKVCGEQLVKAASRASGLIYNIIRCSNGYGPRQSPEKLIPRAIKSIFQNQPIPLYGNGLQLRQWTHIFDICKAVSIIINNGADNEIYNISSAHELSNIEIVQKLCNILEKGHNLMSHIDHGPIDFRRALNSDKLKKLGWEPNYKIKNGLSATIEWYSNNQWFLK